mmetsp:Transcript_3962/g.11696  ORF Transcript_3962/g.11696 Transcript_3962/m.11696 type:complete len:283 (+) Transcript_3962:43-891(+)
MTRKPSAASRRAQPPSQKYGSYKRAKPRRNGATSSKAAAGVSAWSDVAVTAKASRCGVVGAQAAAALARAVIDDGGRGLSPSFVSPELEEHLKRVFGPVGRSCAALAADPSDLLALLDSLRAVPAPFRGDVPAGCVVATGVDAFWDEMDGAGGFVSLSEFEEMRGEDAVDAYLEAQLASLAEAGTTLVAFDGEHRQMDRRGVARLAELYRQLGGPVEEVGYLGDDDLLLRCAVDELVRRGARRERILWLSGEDRPGRAAEWYGLNTAYLGGPGLTFAAEEVS